MSKLSKKTKAEKRKAENTVENLEKPVDITAAEHPGRPADKIMGGGPLGVFLSISKPLSSTYMEGDPPLGKERGALGVGTGPTLPPTDPELGGTPKKPKIRTSRKNRQN